MSEETGQMLQIWQENASEKQTEPAQILRENAIWMKEIASKISGPESH